MSINACTYDSRRYKVIHWLLFFWVFLLCFSTLGQSRKSWDIRKFGAIADGRVINTRAIQQAINECASDGGGEVLITEGTYISGTILLKDNVVLHITENAKLISSINPNDFISIDPFIDATGQYRGQCLIGAINVANVGVIGKGTIDGRGEMFKMENIEKTMQSLNEELIIPKLPKVDTSKQNYINKNIKPSYRPFLLRFVKTKGITIEGVQLRQPAAWTLHFYQCKDFTVDGVDIYSHANQNNDGIDIDSSTDGIIKNTQIDSGDDAICFKTTSPNPTSNIKVENCHLSSHWGAIKFGTESMGDFTDIDISNCRITNTKGGGIKILSVDGANISNVTIDNIEMSNVDMPIFIRLGERRLVYRDAPRQEVGSIDRVIISNVTAQTRKRGDSRLNLQTGIFITGTPDYPIGNIELANINIRLPGGGLEKDSEVVVAENETKYPEFTFFGESLPASGLYARHINSLDTLGLHFKYQLPEERQTVIIENE